MTAPRMLLVALLVGASVGLLGSTGQGQDECESVKGKLTGGFTGPLSTAGEIKAGLLKGTTSFAGEDLEASAGLEPSLVAASTVSYTGLVTITTTDGAVTLRDVGIFDTDVAGGEGEFASRSRVVAGTGIFAGATGIVFFSGDTAPDFTFVADVSGRICLAP